MEAAIKETKETGTKAVKTGWSGRYLRIPTWRAAFLLIEKNQRIFDKRQFGSLRKEEIMEAAEPKKTKRGFWNKFYNFLAMGGFLLVLVVIVAIIVVVSILFK